MLLKKSLEKFRAFFLPAQPGMQLIFFERDDGGTKKQF